MYDRELARAILEKLDEVSEKLDFPELKAALPGFRHLGDPIWLKTLEVLWKNGEIRGEFLLGQGVEWGAEIYITERGRAALRRLRANDSQIPSDSPTLLLDPMAGETTADSESDSTPPDTSKTTVNLNTPDDRKAATEAWKRHWSLRGRQCTNDDLTETAFSQKDTPFLNQWENGKTRLKNPNQSGRIHAIERVLRDNIPPKWHPDAGQH
jgi:hypothetical protein